MSGNQQATNKVNWIQQIFVNAVQKGVIAGSIFKKLRAENLISMAYTRNKDLPPAYLEMGMRYAYGYATTLQEKTRLVLNLNETDQELVGSLVTHELVHADQKDQMSKKSSGFFPLNKPQDYILTSLMHECHAYCSQAEEYMFSAAENLKIFDFDTINEVDKLNFLMYFMGNEQYSNGMDNGFFDDDIRRVGYDCSKMISLSKGKRDLYAIERRKNFAANFFDMKGKSNSEQVESYLLDYDGDLKGSTFGNYFNDGMYKNGLPFSTLTSYMETLGRPFLSPEDWASVFGTDQTKPIVNHLLRRSAHPMKLIA